jgi:hypothetical protein
VPSSDVWALSLRLTCCPAVSALWQGQSPRGALVGNYRAAPRAVIALPP